MAKVEIIGPRDLLLPTLSVVRDAGVLQIDAPAAEPSDITAPRLPSPLLHDRRTLAEHLFYENLKRRIDALLANLPDTEVRQTYLGPERTAAALDRLVDRHDAYCQSRRLRLRALRQELLELDRFSAFLAALAPLLGESRTSSQLDFVGVQLREPGLLDLLTRTVHRLTEGRFELHTTDGPQGELIVLIATEQGAAARLRSALQREQLPEVAAPAGTEELSFGEKLQTTERRRTQARDEIARLELELNLFSRRWRSLYRFVATWLGDQLALLRETATLRQTEMCFVLLGWMAAADVDRTRRLLTSRFAGAVLLEEKELHDEDLERIPVAMNNPGYFRPFELLTRMLPLPRYGTIDPTPFMALFFPLFFGMILGDIGYGLLLLATALTLVFGIKGHPDLISAGKILGVCALYTIFFGWVFGECFGSFGASHLGLEPVGPDRMTAILPMFWFSLAVGAAHVMLGLILGSLSALRRQLRREALFKLGSLVAIIGLGAYLVSFLVPEWVVLRGPLRLAALVLLPLLVLTGGLLAPLELLKTIGNIVSYARIMAVGLSSVLLAYVANRLAGAVGSVVIGVLVALVLHAFNILLGLFAPTIHSLRLHYVEFFGKFLEPGGRKFEPLERK